MIIKNKIYTISIVFILITIVLVFFVIFPFLEKIRSNSQKLISQKQDFANLEIKIKSLEQFKNFYQDYQPKLIKIDTLFVDKDAPINFIEFLEKNARDSQVTIEISLLPFEKIEDDHWSSLRFRIAIKGSPSNFLEFLDRLENSHYLVEVKGLNVERLNKNNTFINAIFLLKVYTK